MNAPISTEALLDIVRQRHADPALSLKSVSQSLNVSAEHLGRIFTRRTGVSFRQYLLTVRIASAIELLTTSDHEIKTVAELVGYRYQSHFCDDFHANVGITPKEFRAKYTPLNNGGISAATNTSKQALEVFLSRISDKSRISDINFSCKLALANLH